MDVTLPDGTVLNGVPDGTTKAQLTAKLQANGYDVSKLEAKPSVSDSSLVGIAAGLGSGVGNVALGAQHYLGKGLGAIGAESASKWLVDDAAKGRENLKKEIAPYKQVSPYAAGGGELAGEIISTLPVGGLLGAGAKAVGANSLANALRTGGMTTGADLQGAKWLGAKGVDMAARVAGGAATGGASAGLVNPDDAGTGALIGAAMPAIIKGAGGIGRVIGEKSSQKYADALSKFNREAPKRETLKEAFDAGYVIPPNMVNPSAKNAIIESFSGKQATSQVASVKNQDVTEKLVRQSLGLAEGAPLTKGALEQIRKVEGGAYKKVSELSDSAATDLEALKQSRNEAQGWFNAYNRSASPEDLAKAKGFRDAAEALELKLEGYAKEAGKDELVPALREARKQIAKTYTVERALNDGTGSVNTKVIGRMFEKGKPLSDGLDVVGKFSNAFPQVNQSAQQMGSPAAHNLRSMASLLLAGGGAAAAGPAGVAAAAVPFIAPMASRSMMFRRGAQEALSNPTAPTISNAKRIAELLQNQQAQEIISRGAPVGITSTQGR